MEEGNYPKKFRPTWLPEKDLEARRIAAPVARCRFLLKANASVVSKVAGTVTGLRVPRSAHWIAEENPLAFTEGSLKFLQPVKVG